MQLFLNNWDAYLAAPAAHDAQAMTVTPEAAAALGEIPAGDHVVATLEGEEGIEIVHITGVSGTTLTVVRAQEGTPALFWPLRSMFQARVTAATLAGLQSQGGAGWARFGGPRVPVGQSVCPFQVVTAGNTTITGSQLRAVPFEVDSPMRVDAFGIRIQAAVADASVRVGLYASDADGWPAELLTSAIISTSVANHRMGDLIEPYELLPGRVYWFAAKFSAAVNVHTSIGQFFAVAGSGEGVCALQRSVPSAGIALPDLWNFTLADIPASLTLNPPFITMRRSA